MAPVEEPSFAAFCLTSLAYGRYPRSSPQGDRAIEIHGMTMREYMARTEDMASKVLQKIQGKCWRIHFALFTRQSERQFKTESTFVSTRGCLVVEFCQTIRHEVPMKNGLVDEVGTDSIERVSPPLSCT